MSLALNTKHLSSFIKEEEYKAIYPQVEAAHKQLEAPVEQGQTLGKAAVYQGEELLEEYEVRAAADAPRMTVRDAIGLLWQSLTGAA